MRLYSLLLQVFYPASFRAEYAGQMQAILGERLRKANGLPGRIAILGGAVLDVFPNAARAHLDILRQDLRHTLRSLGRTPGFAASVVLVAALGIGATTATFSILDHVLLRPLPFPEPDRLVRVWQDQSYRGYAEMEASPPNFRDWKRMSGSFTQLGATLGVSSNLVGRGEPRRLDGVAATHEVLPLLGTAPTLGRFFSEEEDRAGSPGTLLISDSLWKSQFAADPAVLGTSVLLDEEPFTIIGVMPPDFAYPNRETQFWMPARFPESFFEDRTNYCLHVVGRMQPGVALSAARAEMRGVAASLERAFPKENAKNSATVNPLSDRLSERSRLLVKALFGAALAVLLIACTNLAGLLVARALARRRELSVRAALGAGRERLLRQLLTESLVLALGGGLLGVGIAIVATPGLARLIPQTLPVTAAPTVDPRVLLFAAALTIVTGIAFGVLPALRACGDANADALRDGDRAGTGRPAERLRSALVVAEVAASVALLATSGLLVRSLWKLQAVDPGFTADGVLTLGTPLAMPKYEAVEKRQVFYDRVLGDIRALPGVREAGLISFLPMTMGGGIWPVGAPGQPEDATRSRVASLRFVTPGYFAAMAMPLKAGRLLGETDTAAAPRVAVVSESFARQNFAGENPLGGRFQFAFEERTVVGVVADVRVRGLERTSEPQVYLPHRQMSDGDLTWFVPKNLAVRSSVAPATLLPSVRAILSRADPQLPISDVKTLAAILDDDSAPRRVQASALAIFAGAALVLAAIGIHGLLAFTVSRRSREIGIRVALGAGRNEILRMVVARGLALAGIGVAAGALLAYAAGRGMQALLVGLSPADAPAFLGAAAGALLMTAAGCLAPALRALRVDPSRALRAE